MNDVIPLSGADSPCPFDLVFTSTGTVKMTTFYDNSGTHLATGNIVDTGKEFAFHVPGDGIVFGQDGRLTFAADGTELAFDGRSVLDVAALCAALAP